MKIEDIKDLIEIINETDIGEFSYEADGVKLCIRKGSPVSQVPVPSAAPVNTGQQQSHVEYDVQAAGNASPGEDADDEDNYITVTAPMVGTFYRAPAPDAEPYVKPGQIVEVGQPLCIIEAMKLMNEIESEVRGRIERIVVENGEPVEYGQPLFVIAPE